MYGKLFVSVTDFYFSLPLDYRYYDYLSVVAVLVKRDYGIGFLGDDHGYPVVHCFHRDDTWLIFVSFNYALIHEVGEENSTFFGFCRHLSKCLKDIN